MTERSLKKTAYAAIGVPVHYASQARERLTNLLQSLDGVRERLSDQEVELAAVGMRSDFAAGDLIGGLRRGVAMLAEHARPRQRTLHADPQSG